MITDIEHVINNNMCVGCGACSAATGGKVTVQIGRWDTMTASVTNVDANTRAAASRVCPFSHDAPDATTIAKRHYADSPHFDERTGYFREIWAGRVTDESALLKSSSGGLTGWIAAELLRTGLVDGVIHVANSTGPELFEYTVSYSVGEVESRRKSMYYSTSMAAVLNSIENDGKRYALVGVPCFIRAARALSLEKPEFAEQLKYFVGLVCGHLKTRAFAEALAWQTGVSPEDLETVDFRMKNPQQDAGGYDFGARSIGEEGYQRKPTRNLLGGNWGHTMFQANACNYCDDIFAETADVVLGDAWLPRYRKDWLGTNVALVRNEEIADLIRIGIAEGRLDLESLDLEDLVTSQAGNFRHRRVGLAVRLQDDKVADRWLPATRTEPSYDGVSRRRIDLIRLRRKIASQSEISFREAKESGNIEDFLSPMRAMTAQYANLSADRTLKTRAKQIARALRARMNGLLK